MKKSSIAGWRFVFSFTLRQTLKSKAFIVTYFLFIILALVSMPLIKTLSSKGAEASDKPSPITKVYVDNETSLPGMEFSALKNNAVFSRTEFEVMKEDYNTVSGRIESSEQQSVILTVTESDGMYSLNFVKASKGPVKSGNLSALGDAVLEQFDQFKINALGITADQNAMLNADVTSKVSMLDANGNAVIKEDTSISDSEYWFIYGILFVVMMVNSMASAQIATSIVTEKSTRVVEYLLTSIKPLALIIGKVIAMLTAVLLQMVSWILILFVSNKITAVMSTGDGQSVFSQYLPKDIFQNLNIVNIALCLILIVLGLIFYATLAGLAGATVSRLEEIQEGLTLFTFTNIIGAYVGIAAANVMMAAGTNGFVTFALLFPLSSPFVLPGAILVGKAGFLLVAGALALQVVFIVLLFRFVAKVYEMLILHNGNKIKVKDLIKLSKIA